MFKGLLASTHDIADKTLDTSIYRPRIKRIDIEVLASLCGIRDLDKRMHSGDSLSIVNGTGLTEEHFKDATTISNDIRFTDVKHISIGAATVGAAGKYATLVLAYGDLVNLTGDLTFTVISAIAAAAQADVTEDLKSFTLLTTSSIDPLSDPTRNGNLITVTSDTGAFFNRPAGIGTFIQEKLFMTRTVAGLNVTRPLLYSRVPSANIVCRYRNNMFNLGGLQGTGIYSDNVGAPLYISNNTFYNGGTYCIYIDTLDGNINSIYSNNNMCGTAVGIVMNNNAGTLRNNIACTGGANYSNIGAITGINNFGTDATGADGNFAVGSSGNQINQVAANGFQSLVNTDANFLDIIAGGIFDGAGVANDAALARTLCGRGRQVPGPNGTSVGVAERITPTHQSHTAISNTIAIM